MPRKITKFISLLLCLCLICQQAGFAQIMPAPQAAILSSPPLLRYLSVNSANPFNYFNFLMDKGTATEGSPEHRRGIPDLNSEAKKLINYFFLGITLPSESFWVNLRPDEPGRITSDDLAKTDLGRMLLEQDLQLKRDVAKLIHPNNPKGKEFWEAFYAAIGKDKVKKAEITTSNRVWIVPEEAIVVETEDGAFVASAKLKVLLENDYLEGLFPQKAEHPPFRYGGVPTSTLKGNVSDFQNTQFLSEKFMREIILPPLTEEINNGPTYAPLRQIYQSLILAEWFKRKHKTSNSVYSHCINKGYTKGLESELPWSKQAIWQEYRKSYRNGEYKLEDTIFGLKRMYFSGGITLFGQFARNSGASPIKIISQEELRKNSELLNNLTAHSQQALIEIKTKPVEEGEVPGADINITPIGPEKLEEASSPLGLSAKGPSESGASSDISSAAESPVFGYTREPFDIWRSRLSMPISKETLSLIAKYKRGYFWELPSYFLEEFTKRFAQMKEKEGEVFLLNIFKAQKQQKKVSLTWDSLFNWKDGKAPTIFYNEIRNLLPGYNLVHFIALVGSTIAAVDVTEFFFINGIYVGYGVTRIPNDFNDLEMQFQIFPETTHPELGRGKVSGLSQEIFKARLNLWRQFLPQGEYGMVTVEKNQYENVEEPTFYLNLGFRPWAKPKADGSPDYSKGLDFQLERKFAGSPLAEESASSAMDNGQMSRRDFLKVSLGALAIFITGGALEDNAFAKTLSEEKTYGKFKDYKEYMIFVKENLPPDLKELLSNRDYAWIKFKKGEEYWDRENGKEQYERLKEEVRNLLDKKYPSYEAYSEKMHIVPVKGLYENSGRKIDWEGGWLMRGNDYKAALFVDSNFIDDKGLIDNALLGIHNKSKKDIFFILKVGGAFIAVAVAIVSTMLFLERRKDIIKKHYMTKADSLLFDGKLRVKSIQHNSGLINIISKENYEYHLQGEAVLITKKDYQLKSLDGSFPYHNADFNSYSGKIIEVAAKYLLSAEKQNVLFNMKDQLDGNNAIRLSMLFLDILSKQEQSPVTLKDMLVKILTSSFDYRTYQLAVYELKKLSDTDEMARLVSLLDANDFNSFHNLYPDDKQIIQRLMEIRSEVKYSHITDRAQTFINQIVLKNKELFPWIIDKVVSASENEKKEWLETVIRYIYDDHAGINFFINNFAIISKVNPGITSESYDSFQKIFNELGRKTYLVRPILDGSFNHILKECGSDINKFYELVLQDEKVDQGLRESLLENAITNSGHLKKNILNIIKSDESYYKKFIDKLNSVRDFFEKGEFEIIFRTFNPDLIPYFAEVQNIFNNYLSNIPNLNIRKLLIEGFFNTMFEPGIDIHKFIINVLKNDKYDPETKKEFIRQYFNIKVWSKDVLEQIKSDNILAEYFIDKYVESSGIREHDLILEVFNPNLHIDKVALNNILSSFENVQPLKKPFISGICNEALMNSEGENYKFLRNVLNSPTELYGVSMDKDTKISILKVSPSKMIARALNVNIKLARYLKERADNFNNLFNRLSEPAFKEKINEISYNINREITLYPKERRIGEDEKTSLFDILFESQDITAAKEIFDNYFRNAPDGYRIDIQSLNELLKYVKLQDIEKIIKGIVDNPKQSLDEVTESIKRQTQGMENAEFIVRKIGWILSNLFILEDKIGQLGPIVKTLDEKGGTINDLISMLAEVDKAKGINELNNIALANGLNFMDIFRFKLESAPQQTKEDLLVDGLQSIDSWQDTQAEELFSEMSAQFGYQPKESKIRIYLKALFNQTTDNSRIVAAIEELKTSDTLSGFKKSPLLKQFLIENRALVAENTYLDDYSAQIAALSDKNQQKEAFKQLRSLYQDRQYASTKLSSDEFTELRKTLEKLQQQIELNGVRTQIPHAYYESLLKINPDTNTFETIRQLIASINAHKELRNNSADIKNGILDKIILFSSFEYDLKAKLFSRMIESIVKGQGLPSLENIDAFRRDFVSNLEQFSKVLDTYQKAKNNLFPESINQKLQSLSTEILDDLLLSGKINDGKLKELAERLALIEADVLLARFKMKTQVENEEEVVEGLKQYAAHNPRFKWVDSQKRNIYQLVDIYLKTISDKEIYDGLLAALEAEIEGKFKQWKYESQDYKDTLDEIIKIEVEKMLPEEQKIFWRQFSSMDGKTNYDKLANIEGFEKIKAKIQKIKNWENTLQKELEDGTAAEFTDDFYALFNIGNSDRFSACQSCVYGNDLNRGLSGYLMNGTNKAVALLDENRNVISRRIVRLRILKDEQNNRFPAIFVEESTQFGQTGIDELYNLLDILSQKTGLPVVSSNQRAANTKKVSEGISKPFAIELYNGRSAYDYSDLYGSSVPGHLTAGLYKQVDPKVITGTFSLLVKDIPAGEIDKSVKINNIEFSRSVASPMQKNESASSAVGISRREILKWLAVATGTAVIENVFPKGITEAAIKFTYSGPRDIATLLQRANEGDRNAIIGLAMMVDYEGNAEAKDALKRVDSTKLVNKIRQDDHAINSMTALGLLVKNSNVKAIDALTDLIQEGNSFAITELKVMLINNIVLSLRNAHLDQRIDNEELERRLFEKTSDNPFLLYACFTSRENFGDLAKMISNKLKSHAKDKGTDIYSFLKDLDRHKLFYEEFILQSANFSFLSDIISSPEALSEVMQLLLSNLSVTKIRNYSIRLALFVEAVLRDKNFAYQKDFQNNLMKLYLQSPDSQNQGLNKFFIASLLDIYRDDLKYLDKNEIDKIVKSHGINPEASLIPLNKIFEDGKFIVNIVFADKDAATGYFNSNFNELIRKGYIFFSQDKAKVVFKKGNTEIKLFKAAENLYDINDNIQEADMVIYRGHAGGELGVFGTINKEVDYSGKIMLVSSCRSATIAGLISGIYPAANIITINGTAYGDKTDFVTEHLIEEINKKSFNDFQEIKQSIIEKSKDKEAMRAYVFPGDRSVKVGDLIRREIEKISGADSTAAASSLEKSVSSTMEGIKQKLITALVSILDIDKARHFKELYAKRLSESYLDYKGLLKEPKNLRVIADDIIDNMAKNMGFDGGFANKVKTSYRILVDNFTEKGTLNKRQSYFVNKAAQTLFSDWRKGKESLLYPVLLQPGVLRGNKTLMVITEEIASEGENSRLVDMPRSDKINLTRSVTLGEYRSKIIAAEVGHLIFNQMLMGGEVVDKGVDETFDNLAQRLIVPALWQGYDYTLDEEIVKAIKEMKQSGVFSSGPNLPIVTILDILSWNQEDAVMDLANRFLPGIDFSSYLKKDRYIFSHAVCRCLARDFVNKAGSIEKALEIVGKVGRNINRDWINDFELLEKAFYAELEKSTSNTDLKKIEGSVLDKGVASPLEKKDDTASSAINYSELFLKQFNVLREYTPGGDTEQLTAAALIQILNMDKLQIKFFRDLLYASPDKVVIETKSKFVKNITNIINKISNGLEKKDISDKVKIIQSLTDIREELEKKTKASSAVEEKGGIDLSNIELTLKDESYISNLNPADIKVLRAAKALKDQWDSLSLLYVHEIMMLMKDEIIKDIQNKELLQNVLQQLQIKSFLDPQAVQFLNLIQSQKPISEMKVSLLNQ